MHRFHGVVGFVGVVGTISGLFLVFPVRVTWNVSVVVFGSRSWGGSGGCRGGGSGGGCRWGVVGVVRPDGVPETPLVST